MYLLPAPAGGSFSHDFQRGLVSGQFLLQPFHLAAQFLVLRFGRRLLRPRRAGALVDQLLQRPGIPRCVPARVADAG